MVFFQREFIPEEDRGANQRTCNGDTREPNLGVNGGTKLFDAVGVA